MRRRVLSFVLALMLVVGSGVGVASAAEPRVVNVSDAAALIAAVRDLQPGDTLVLAAGTYDVERQLGDLSFGGQTGWYLPLWQDGVTLQGAGPGDTILTSSTYSANGNWSSQDFISIWANGVTVEGVTIYCKQDTNKAIEVMGRDFTLRDTDVMTNPLGPWPGWPDDVFSGSVYFNPQLAVTGAEKFVGQSQLEDVYVEGAWVSAPVSAVASGTISLSNTTVDWIQAAYAPYWTFYGTGMMSANPVFSAGDGVRFIVDETAESVADQASAKMPSGADLEYVATHDLAAELAGRVFTEVKDAGVYPAGTDLYFHLYEDAAGYVDGYESPADAGAYLYGWHFVATDVDPSFEATFYPGIGVKTTLDTDKADMIAAADLPDNGLDAVELDFTHEGALPGPASVSIYVGTGLAGTTFDLVQYSDDEISTTSLSDPVDSVTVDADGYVSIAFDTGDVWYLLEDVETSFVRYDGASRFDTAAEAALADFPKGADVAVIAYAWDFPDALAASTLAGIADAPILLTDTDVLSPVTASTLEALGVERVYIVGGRNVVSEAVLDELAGDYTVRRLGGVDRYATARLIADEAVRLGAVSDKAFLAYGGNFADALSVSSVAAQKGIPVLLTRTATLDAGAAAFIDDRGVDDVYIAGGELAVSEDVEIAVEAFGTRVTRWGGANRYETAAAVADGSKSAFGVNFLRVGVASGTNFPDALAAGAALGMQDGMLLITDPVALSGPTEGLIVANSANILSVEFFGGTVALSQAVEDRVRELLQ